MGNVPIHERMKAYITEQNINQKLMAENMDVSETKLSMMLNGKRRMTIEDYIKACKAISVSPTKFIV